MSLAVKSRGAVTAKPGLPSGENNNFERFTTSKISKFTRDIFQGIQLISNISPPNSIPIQILPGREAGFAVTAPLDFVARRTVILSLSNAESPEHGIDKSKRLGLRRENLENGSCRVIKSAQLNTWAVIWGQGVAELDWA